jgi:hypothetical protein
MLHHQDGVRPAGQHATRGDRCREAFAHRLLGHDAGCEHLAVQPYASRRLFHRAECVRRLHGEAVDVGTVESGNVHFGQHIFGKDTIQSFPQ